MTGEHFVSGDDIILQTVLGSCISVCLYSDVSPIGGMNHFMLPDGTVSDFVSDSGRYGVYSMELLINDLMKAGVPRASLKAKVFGGGSIQELAGRKPVGEQNISFAFKFLEVEKIPIESHSVGGDIGRKIMFFIRSQCVLLKKIEKSESELVIAHQDKERTPVKEILPKPDITYF